MKKYADMTTEELVADYNATFGKNIKKGSYTRAKMTKALEEANPANSDTCPFCNAEEGQSPAGEVGTFLGDSVTECSRCGKSYNRYTKEAVEIGRQKKRRILNPQVKIEAKIEACAKEGVEVFYNRPDRIWVFADNTSGKTVFQMTSKEFSKYPPSELVTLVQKQMKKAG